MGNWRQSVVVMWTLTLAGVVLSGGSQQGSAADSGTSPVPAPRGADTAPDGWIAGAPRDEIRPEFGHQPGGAADGRACLIIRADHREGLDGYWKKVFSVSGGKAYRFQASYQAKGIAVPRRSVVAEIHG